jgi:hypothetical protein
MATVFFLRHQAAGTLAEFPFAEHPTEKQIQFFETVMATRHGLIHPKTKEPYWLRVYPAELLGPGFLPEIPGITGGGVRAGELSAALDNVDVEGQGTVTNPPEREG